eukprot:SAG11_NODE_10293_length_841_cov_1.936658_2_plen_151_part_01
MGLPSVSRLSTCLSFSLAVLRSRSACLIILGIALKWLFDRSTNLWSHRFPKKLQPHTKVPGDHSRGPASTVPRPRGSGTGTAAGKLIALCAARTVAGKTNRYAESDLSCLTRTEFVELVRCTTRGVAAFMLVQAAERAWLQLREHRATTLS